MPSIALTDTFVSLNGTDISAQVQNVTIDYSAEVLDTTAMGDFAKTRIAGLKDFKVTLTLKQDYATTKIDSIIFPLIGTVVAIILRSIKATAVGVSNPNYTGNVLVESYSPISGAVGALAQTPLSLPGSGLLTRATS
jgi:hypothetical protein